MHFRSRSPILCYLEVNRIVSVLYTRILLVVPVELSDNSHSSGGSPTHTRPADLELPMPNLVVLIYR